jgi:RNA polymerase sigma factor (sigma-70 family)
MSNSIPSEENKFIEGIRAGDQAVIKRVYAKHYPLVRNFILKNKGQEDDARDIYQESMTIFCRNLQHEPEFVLTCNIGTFLYSVARRLWLKQLRSSNKTGVLPESYDAEQEELTGMHWEKEGQIDLMMQSMELLGEPCKTLLSDFYIQKMSMDDISDKFGYTNADNAKNQKYKCLQRLKKIFFERYRENS